MLNYVLRRLLAAVFTVLGISVVVFSMMHFLPGDPVDVLSMEQKLSAEVKQQIRHEWGLDLPLHQQYFRFLKGAVKGDFGRSVRSGRPVWDEIKHRYVNTLKLALCAIVISSFLGITFGVLSAAKKDSLLDNLLMVLCLLGVSVPGFWLGLLMIYLFSLKLHLLPVAGSGPKQLIMPALLLGITGSAVIARMTRSTMLDVLRAEYVTTARSKGLPEKQVLFGHSFKNAIIPILTILGLQFAGYLAGAFITESVFAYNGIGTLGVRSISTRDFPLTQGVIFIDAVTVVGVNLVVDTLYTLFDPRIRYD
ncbi:MAG TPA: ABC transporter permease [Firmicutes bacterium]|jgi:peptide/nickel transport system permease protein|nr:ABC transporter permease [Bacillota bacterium]